MVDLEDVQDGCRNLALSTHLEQVMPHLVHHGALGHGWESVLNYGTSKRILGVYNILKMEILTISKFCSPCTI